MNIPQKSKPKTKSSKLKDNLGIKILQKALECIRYLCGHLHFVNAKTSKK